MRIAKDGATVVTRRERFVLGQAWKRLMDQMLFLTCKMTNKPLACLIPSLFHNFSICSPASNFLAGCMIRGCGRGDIWGNWKANFPFNVFRFLDASSIDATSKTAQAQIQSGVKTVVTKFPILCHTSKSKHRRSKIDCLGSWKCSALSQLYVLRISLHELCKYIFASFSHLMKLYEDTLHWENGGLHERQ